MGLEIEIFGHGIYADLRGFKTQRHDFNGHAFCF
jgi:hypothetical protein